MADSYPRGFDSGFASDADYEDGFVASDATVWAVAQRQGISTDRAKSRLGMMDRLREANARADREEGLSGDGPEYGA